MSHMIAALQRYNVRVLRRGSVALLLLGVLLLPGVVFANAAPPPNLVWFRFVDEPAERLGVQVVDCNKPDCDARRLAEQDGVCDAAGCLPPATEDVPHFGPLVCHADRCMYVHDYGGFRDEDAVQLIVQYADGVRQSNVFQIEPENASVYRIDVQVLAVGNELRIEPDPQPDAKQMRPRDGFILTLAIELAVAALFLARLALPRRELLILLGMITLINLLSFPVVWLYFPSLGYFAELDQQTTGNFVLLSAVVYGGVVGGIRWIDSLRLRWLVGVLAVLSIPVVFFAGLFFTGLANYGGSLPSTDGLPYSTMLALSELFAFAFEAVLIWLASRRALTFLQTVLLSFLMNAASFLGGLLWLVVTDQLILW